MKHSKKHPGFQTEARKIARRQDISIERADKILGYAKAHASAKAKQRNPRLRRV